MEVLLVEDGPGDVLMTREAFEEHGLAGTLPVVGDGVDASRSVHHEGPFADVPTPDLVLLHPDLPRLDGLEVQQVVDPSTSVCAGAGPGLAPSGRLAAPCTLVHAEDRRSPSTRTAEGPAQRASSAGAA